MKVELASIPAGQTAVIAGFVEGAKKTLARLPCSDAGGPTRVSVEYRISGNCHIWLEIGRWQDGKNGPEAIFDAETGFVA